MRVVPKVGPGVGLGHLMRCVALAEKLCERGAEDVAVLLPARATERAIVRRAALRIGTLEAGEELPGDSAYVVDLELPREAWPLRFASGPLALAAIDNAGLDLADVDLIVNPNVHADPTWYPGHATLAIGPRFALLRREFEAARRRPRKTRERGRRIVISLGGSDLVKGTERILLGIADLDVQVDAILGPGFRRSVRRPDGARAEIRLHRNSARMAPHFLAADLAITGGGSTLYEVAACGTPALSVSFNEAQRAHATRWEALGAVEYLGSADRVDPETLQSRVGALLENAARRRAMSRKGRALVDGRGTDRAATMLFRVMAHPRNIQR